MALTFSEVHSGTVDVVATAMAVTPERMEVGNFGIPFFQAPIIAYVRKLHTSGTGLNEEHKGEFILKIFPQLTPTT